MTVPIVPGPSQRPVTLATLMPPAPPRRGRLGLWIAVAAVAVVLVAGGTLGVLAYLNRTPTKPQETAVPFDVIGDLTLSPPGLGSALAFQIGRPCEGSGGYDDIHAGAEVVVYGAHDETVGVGRLTAGSGSGSSDFPVCVFTLTVPNVPAGLRFYAIEVAHRGKVHFTEAQIHERVQLTLGG